MMSSLSTLQKLPLYGAVRRQMVAYVREGYVMLAKGHFLGSPERPWRIRRYALPVSDNPSTYGT